MAEIAVETPEVPAQLPGVRVAVLGAGKMGGILLQAFLKENLFAADRKVEIVFEDFIRTAFRIPELLQLDVCKCGEDRCRRALVSGLDGEGVMCRFKVGHGWSHS